MDELVAVEVREIWVRASCIYPAIITFAEDVLFAVLWVCPTC
jgi:hypothetical protein